MSMHTKYYGKCPRCNSTTIKDLDESSDQKAGMKIKTRRCMQCRLIFQEIGI